MKTLVSAALLTVLAGTSAAFALPPIPRSIDTGYSYKTPIDAHATYRFGNDHAGTRKINADLPTRNELEHYNAAQPNVRTKCAFTI
jgi:hypothetical protein